MYGSGCDAFQSFLVDSGLEEHRLGAKSFVSTIVDDPQDIPYRGRHGESKRERPGRIRFGREPRAGPVLRRLLPGRGGAAGQGPCEAKRVETVRETQERSCIKPSGQTAVRMGQTPESRSARSRPTMHPGAGSTEQLFWIGDRETGGVVGDDGVGGTFEETGVGPTGVGSAAPDLEDRANSGTARAVECGNGHGKR